VYEELNFSIFVIDIRLMLVQYKYWRTERINNGLEYNTGTFVYTFLFVKLMPLLIDYAILNNYLLNPMTERKDIDVYTPVSIFDLTNRILNVLRYERKTAVKRKHTLDLYTLLKNVPSLNCNNQYEVQFTGPMFKTKNNWWSFILSNSSTLISLFDFVGTRGIRMNHTILTDIARALRLTGSFSSFRLGEFELVASYEFDRLREIINKRNT
jgi:hypothetical protein